MVLAPDLNLDSSVRYLKGVGPRREKILAHLGLATIRDLIIQTPRAWEDRRLKPQEPPGLKNGRASFCCRVLKTQEISSPTKNFIFYKAESQTDHHYLPRLTLTWIRRRSRFDPFGKLRRECRVASRLLVFGRLGASHPASGHVEMFVEEYEPLDSGLLPKSSPHWLRLVPVYPAADGIYNRQLREWRWKALSVWRNSPDPWRWPEEWQSFLPKPLLEVGGAYEAIHFPSDERHRDLARKTLAFWEIMQLALAMEWRRRATILIRKSHQYRAREISPFFVRLTQKTGHVLTKGQERAIGDILTDLAKPQPMNRLIQGEVGSGKTMVAMAAICQAIDSGHQAAFIAPTEILVFQHYVNLRPLLDPLGIRLACLTSETPAKERRQTLDDLKKGLINLIIGTHSLLEAEVMFASLGLVIIDEQHRFGVDQRWKLRSKSFHPDCLILSATPIPRTLALALYGDLDISTIEDLPPGHVIAKTVIAKTPEEAWPMVAERLKEGLQAYVVVPAIEMTSESFNLEQEVEELNRVFPGVNISALHGRMPASQKEQALSQFTQGQTVILAATTVIEVGIDVRQAATIVILGADHFGLATLHQLRGRVGRGNHDGLCILVPSPKIQQANASKEARTKGPDESVFFEEDSSKSLDRLEKFCLCRNGFEIGQLDLEWRGQGDLLGWSQHGGSGLRHFDWKDDVGLIAPARLLAGKIMEEDPDWRRYPRLRCFVEERFGKDFFKSDIS